MQLEKPPVSRRDYRGWLEEETNSRLRRLVRLDRVTEVQRSQLQASGVGQATIAALYPLDFPALIPGLIALLEPSSLKKLRALSGLDSETNRAFAIRQRLPADLRAQVEEPDEETFELLLPLTMHIESLLSDSRAMRQAVIARRLALIIRDCCHLMANIECCGDAELSVRSHFLNLTDAYMPKLALPNAGMDLA